MTHPGIAETLLSIRDRSVHTPPPDPHEWAEKVYRIPDDNGNPMPFRWDYCPFWEEIFAELLNPDNKEVSLQLFSRGGKTMLCLMGMVYHILEIPRKLAIMRPSKGNAEDFAKKELQQGCIDLMPPLLDLFGDGTNRRQRFVTILDKAYPGGHWKILGSNVAGDIRQVQATILWGDEIDAIEREKGDEGDPMLRFRKRGDQFRERLVWWSSYPTTAKTSRINRRLSASDWRQWTVNCPKCGDPWVMRRTEHLRFEEDSPEKAALECPHCGELHNDDVRIEMARAGKWIPSQPDIQLRPGFHASSLLWPHDVNRTEYPGGYLQKLAESEIDAKRSEDPEGARQAMVTMEDAECYTPPELETPKPESVLDRCEDYRPEVAIPEGVLVITLGADLQGDRIEAEIVGHGLGFREWGLGYYVIPGKPLSKELEKAFDEILSRTFKHPILGEIGIDRAGFDCGYETDWVRMFCANRKHQMRAVRGSNNYATGAVEKVKSEAVTYDGRTKRTKVYTLNTHYLKKQVYDRLENNPKDNPTHSLHWPKGAGYDLKYFRGLTLETPEERSQKGNSFLFFDDKEVKGNEPLDCRVYAKGMLPGLVKTLRRRAREVEGGRTKSVPPPEEKKAAKPVRRRPTPRRGNFVTDY